MNGMCDDRMGSRGAVV